MTSDRFPPPEDAPEPVVAYGSNSCDVEPDGSRTWRETRLEQNPDGSLELYEYEHSTDGGGMIFTHRNLVRFHHTMMREGQFQDPRFRGES